MSTRKQRIASSLGSFLRQYGRPSDPHNDPNDRWYDRRLEQRVQRLPAEEFDALANGDDLKSARALVEASLSAFLRPERRARVRQLLASASGRTKFRRTLAHFRDWEPACITAVEPRNQTPSEIEALLASLDAPDVCYLLSECDTLDGPELALHGALEAVVGSGCGTVIICTPGRLAFYEGEDPGCRFILRTSAA